jgi:flavin-dependent dehydrogenase
MNRNDHAVVIGASMAGLVAARALADHFSRVTVLDQDALPASPAQRKGVPQGRHAHGIQPGGLAALERMFPGLTGDLIAAGASAGDLSGNAQWYVGGGWLSRSVSGTRALGLSRPLLEHAVRSRVGALRGVEVVSGSRVEGLLPGAQDDVAGVRLADGTTLRADLVVDASGRASRLPVWLGDLGFPTPVEEQVHCKMSYLTRSWELADGKLPGDVVAVVTPDETPRFCAVIAQEDGTHIVTLGGLLDDGPERSDGAYLSFAETLPGGLIAGLLDGAAPRSELMAAHLPYSRRRRYDKLDRFPVGLLAIGDAIASFNPMYGQGMTVAALEGEALSRELGRGRDSLARRFFKSAHRIEDVAWKISTGGDLRFDAVEGRRDAAQKVMNRYLDRLTRRARRDPVLAAAFLRVAGFVDRPESLFRPAVLIRVFGPARAGRKSLPAYSPVLAESEA